MAVSIDKITVENVGPLREQTFELGPFNLVYGQNETGKTFLVEFILQSLFRHAANWQLRNITGRGKVTLTGLEKKPTEFTPDSTRKLEDYWEEQDAGLPVNMARLLVVKGSELALSARTPGGVGRSVLKTSLSRESLLDDILSPIQQTLLDASLENGTIIADRRGKIKDREELASELDQLQELVSVVQESYSGGPIRELTLQQEKIQASMQDQRKAKRHHAYQLHQKRQELQEDRSRLQDKKIQDLRDHIRDHQSLASELKQIQNDLPGKKAASKKFVWLKNARETWENMELDRSGQPRTIIAYLGMILITAGMVVGLLNLPWVSFGVTIPGLLLVAYYGWQLTAWSRSTATDQERESIRRAFQEMFDRPLGGLTDIKTRLEQLREDHIQAKQMEDDLQMKKQSLQQLQGDIEEFFHQLTDRNIPPAEWDDELETLRQKARRIDDQLKSLEIELSKLEIAEDQYRSQPGPVQYNQETLRSLQDKAHDLEKEIEKHKGNLDRLKHRICSHTGDDIDTPWNELLDNLSTLHYQKQKRYKSLTAEIVAKIGVTEVLEEVRAEEDEKIRRGLQSESVLHIVNSVTGEYTSLDLHGDQLIVAGEYGNYPLKDLSTGAREQIQLALRMGFASHISGGDPLFLILDDAFQHSDWERRQQLVKRVIDMANTGWQIVYLTMDDHLRDLFLEAGERLFPDQFKSYTLA